MTKDSSKYLEGFVSGSAHWRPFPRPFRKARDLLPSPARRGRVLGRRRVPEGSGRLLGVSGGNEQKRKDKCEEAITHNELLQEPSHYPTLRVARSEGARGAAIVLC